MTIKTFEPAGIGSSDLQECLLIQIEKWDEENEDRQLEHTLVRDFFPLLEKRKYSEIANHLDLAVEEVELAVHHISLLEPKPGRKYQASNNREVIPDASVQEVKGELVLSLNNNYLPRIKFNDEYKALLKTQDNPELTKYLTGEEERARVLLGSIQFRKSNLLKVMEKLLSFKETFFITG